MPFTRIYGLPYEHPQTDQPGITLHGGDPPSSPILAEAVEAEIARVEATVAELRNRVTTVEGALDGVTRARMLSGRVSVTDWSPVSSSFYNDDYFRGEARVVFPDGFFSSRPVIQITPDTNVPGVVMECGFTDDDETGFTVRVARADTTNTGVDWLAVEILD